MLNDVKLVGFVRRNSGLKKTDIHEDPVCNLVLSTKRSWVTRNGDKRDEEIFVDVTAFDDLAEICAREATEGSTLFVEGYIRTTRTEKEGQAPTYRSAVIARRVLFMDKIISRGHGYAPTTSKEGGSSQWKR